MDDLRRFGHPEPGDDWATLARRHFPDRPVEDVVLALKTWNLHLASRPNAYLVPLDLVFLEEPKTDGGD